MSILQEEYRGREFEFWYELTGIVEENVETEILRMKEELNREMKNVHEICSKNAEKWRIHTKKMHKFGKIRAKLYELSAVGVSQAFCKFSEILALFPDVFPSHSIHSNLIRSFHICEGPGYFITGLDGFLSNRFPNMTWQWNAQTLNPYYENTKSCDKLLDDSLIIFEYDCWKFGKDNSGDVFSMAKETEENLGDSEKYDIITADGSIYVQDRPGEQESLVFKLLEAEVTLALKLLAKRGTMIIKMYTFFNKETRKLLKRLLAVFGKCVAFKPCCSKPGNSEKYLIFTNYLGDEVSQRLVSDSTILECEKVFVNRQIEAIRKNLETFASDFQQTNKERKRENRLLSDLAETLSFSDGMSREKRIFPARPECRPWSKMFGHNLVDRISKIQTSQDAQQYIGEFLKNAQQTAISTIINDRKRTEIRVNLEFSPFAIENNHSLFIDPAVLHSMNILDKLGFEDLFSKCAQLSPFHGSANISDSTIVIDCDKLTGFQHILEFLRIILEQEIERVVLKWQPSRKSYILSRLSASICTLLLHVFDKLEIDCDVAEIRFSGQHSSEHQNIKAVISQIHSQISTIDPTMFLRTFIAIPDLATYHQIIYSINLCNLKYYSKV